MTSESPGFKRRRPGLLSFLSRGGVEPEPIPMQPPPIFPARPMGSVVPPPVPLPAEAPVPPVPAAAAGPPAPPVPAAASADQPVPVPPGAIATVPAVADPTPVSAQVALVDGEWCLLTPGGALPFFMGEAPLRSLGAAWGFRALHTLFAPLLLMELEHENGQRATWFFDSELRFAGNDVSGLSPFLQSLLVRRTAEALAALLCRTPDPAADALADAFLRVEEGARLPIASLCGNATPPAQVIVLQRQVRAIAVMPRQAGGEVVALQPERMRLALARPFQEVLTEAARLGELCWPSLVDGRPLPCRAGIGLHDFAFLYRFDEAEGVPFYVIATRHDADSLGIFLPTENLVLARDQDAAVGLGQILPHVGAVLAGHVAEHGGTLRPHLRRDGPKRLAASLRELHLGHHVWNEMSGLERLAGQLPAGSLPMLLPFKGKAIRVFGELESVFPEFAGRAEAPGSVADTIRFGHERDLVPARFTGSHVSAGLRERILAVVRQTPEYGAAAARLGERGGLAILVGLRVENRTAADLPGVLRALVGCIAETLPGAVIVLDGQNGNPSFASDRAARSPAEVELDLCRQVRAAFDPATVPVEIASGQTMATSIAWSDLSRGFVSFWGAGLAKYRWVANKPGLVISNHENLTARGDLHIYDDPACMADPAPIRFVDPAMVTDDPAATQLIALPDPSFLNFHVDLPAFLAEVRAFLAPWRRDGGGA